MTTNDDWRSHAACIGADPKLFFIERGADDRPAKAICASCPVKHKCLDYALHNGEQHGVWGGTSERQRRRLRIERGISRSHRPEALCGTNSGAFRHYARNEALCQACKDAKREYDRKRRGRTA